MNSEPMRMDLSGRRALLTGGRAKIGMYIALRLLRDVADTTITTRFPPDAVRRFRAMRRAWWSFWILAIGYLLCLGSEFIANDRPLVARVDGQWYFPVISARRPPVVEGQSGDGRLDWKALRDAPAFAAAPGNFMVFPPVPYGPFEIVPAQRIAAQPGVELTFAPRQRVGSVDVDAEGVIRFSRAAAFFFGVEEGAVVGRRLEDVWPLPAEVRAQVDKRLRNEPVSAASRSA